MKHVLDMLIQQNIKMLAVLEYKLIELENAREENKIIDEEYVNDWKRNWNKAVIDYKANIKDECDKAMEAIKIKDNM